MRKEVNVCKGLKTGPDASWVLSKHSRAQNFLGMMMEESKHSTGGMGECFWQENGIQVETLRSSRNDSGLSR